MRFRFRLGLTISALPVLLVLISLGNWQVGRLQWKQDLIERVEGRANNAPIALPVRQDLPTDPVRLKDQFDFTHVRVEGRFDHAREITMTGISVEGQGGYLVLTPFFTNDGQWLLVDRGFVPPQFKAQDTRLPGLVSGTVTLTGLLQAPAAPGPFTPDNRPETGGWYHLDLQEMGTALGSDFYPLILNEDKSSGAGRVWPQAGQAKINFPNNHLGYVITWFGLAFALVAVWLAMSLERRKAD